VSRAGEYAGHILRTLGMVVALVGGGILAFLFLHPLAAGALILVGLVLVVFYTAKLQAFWTPVSDRVARFAWEDSAGVPHETVVEMARLESPTFGGLSTVKSRILRVSSYRIEGKRRRLKRELVGDDAEWLGRHGARLWFLVRDRYHSGRKGLVAHDLQTLAVTFHQPGDEVEPEEPRGGRKGRTPPGTGTTVQLDTREGRVTVELASGEVMPAAPGGA
jgi:hypothetical protein